MYTHIDIYVYIYTYIGVYIYTHTFLLSYRVLEALGTVFQECDQDGTGTIDETEPGPPGPLPHSSQRLKGSCMFVSLPYGFLYIYIYMYN